jgi:hypothetical protein
MEQGSSTVQQKYKVNGDETMTKQQPPEQKTIEYIISYKEIMPLHEKVMALQETLAPFAPTYLRQVPIATVHVALAREPSLLETLASMDGITYRRGEPRRAFEDPCD